MPGLSSTREGRLKEFKNLGRHEEMRRRRMEGSVELRKNKKEQALLKRRNMRSEETESELSDNGASSPAKTAPLKLLSLADCAAILLGDQPPLESLETAVESIRRKLSANIGSPPVKEVLSLGLVPPLVQVLCSKPTDKAAFEAAWALTNIVSGTSEETAAVVKAGGLPPLVASLGAVDVNLAEQATWAIGNITGDGAELRDAVLAAGALPAMLSLAHRPDISVEFLRTLAWAFSNFCRHKDPSPPLEVLQTLLPYMAKLLHHVDKTVVSDTCWAVSYITDGTNEQIQAALDSGILPRVVELLNSSEKVLVAPALRALGNIVTGSDQHTQAVIDTGILSARIHQLVFKDTEHLGFASEYLGTLRKEAVWMLSNILAGNSDQVGAVAAAGLFPAIVQCLEHGEHKVRSEAAWCVVNLTTSGTLEQVMGMLEVGVIPAMAALLSVKDTKIVSLLLEALYNFLNKAQALGHLEKVTDMVEECGALDQLEELQQHQDNGIYNLAFRIIHDFFSDEEQEDQAAPKNAGSTPHHASNTRYEF